LRTAASAQQDRLSNLHPHVQPEEAKKDLESLLKKAAKDVIGTTVSPEVVRVIKNDILGTSTFLVTESEDMVDRFLGGVRLKGNCRVEPRAAADTLARGLEERCVLDGCDAASRALQQQRPHAGSNAQDPQGVWRHRRPARHPALYARRAAATAEPHTTRRARSARRARSVTPGNDSGVLSCRYGDQFVVYLQKEAAVWDGSGDTVQSDGKPRVTLSVMPKAVGLPQPAAGWQAFLAFVLFALTFFSTV
jgi:hypothetical protein